MCCINTRTCTDAHRPSAPSPSPCASVQDITLLQFRKTGSRVAQLLLGLRVPDAELPEFWEAAAGLSSEFSMTELGGREEEVFRMFI